MARRRFQRGSIRKRGIRQPIWELQWWEDYIKLDGSIGRRRESTILGYVSEMPLKQARKEAENKLGQVNAGKAIPYSTLSLREFVDQFFVPLALPVLKPSTRKRYQSTLNLHLLPAFGNRRLCDIGTVEVQRFILEKFDKGLGWETCNHLRNLLSKVFVSAKKWGQLAGENPASAVELPEKQPTREKRVLMPDEVTRLLAVLREPVYTMVLIAVLTGLRIGEIIGLRWADVDLDRNELRVEQSVYRGSVGSPKTKGSRRTLPLPEAAVEALKQLAQRLPHGNPERPVFCSRKGTALSDTNLLLRHLKPAGKKIGVPWISWHTFRRTHATLLQLAGGSAKDAQAQLGHAQITTTLGIYTIPVPAHQRAAVEKLSQLVTNGDESRTNGRTEVTEPTLLQ
jgi:integrase